MGGLAAAGEFDCPSYDGGAHAIGRPDGAEEFRRRHGRNLLTGVRHLDAWRLEEPDRLDVEVSTTAAERQRALLLSAPLSMAGDNRGLWALRMPDRFFEPVRDLAGGD
jgi:hypothetical protein